MLKALENLPVGLDGIRATGTVTKDDYDKVFQPVLAAAHDEGRRIRLLYEFAPAFKGFTAGAGLEDARLGLKYLRLFERCAIVSDRTWIRKASELFAMLMPCPVKVFGSTERREALDWLREPVESAIPYRLLPDAGVIVLEPQMPLRAEDFDALALTVDAWLETGGILHGIVVHTQGIPGWTNVGSVLRHVRFIQDHHRKIARVAIAADGKVAELVPVLADLFMKAQLKHFDHEHLDDAIEWVKLGRHSETTGSVDRGQGWSMSGDRTARPRPDDSDLYKGAVESD